MKLGGSMPHSQGPSNNPKAESSQFLVLMLISLRSILILSSHLRLGHPKRLFPAGEILKKAVKLSLIQRTLVTMGKPVLSHGSGKNRIFVVVFFKIKVESRQAK